MPVKGTYLAVAGVGAVLVWSGLRNKQWSDVVRQLIAGKPPASAPNRYTIAGTPLSAVGTGAGIPGLTSGGLAGAKVPTGNPFKANVAVCIASHESGGQVDVLSRNPDGGTNVGLWQLDTPGGKGAGFTVGQLQNPLTNARVAIRGSSNGADWSAWATAGMCGV